MKRILIFSLAYYPKHVGGAEVAIKEITSRIDPQDIAFHMITNRYDSTLPKVEKIGNVLVYRIGIATKNPRMGDLRKFPLHLNKLLFQFTAAWKAYRLHKKYHYDGIWAVIAHATGVPAGIFKTLHSEVGYALTLQEGDPPQYIEAKMRVFGPLFRRGFTKADVVQTISMFLATWARRMGFTGPLEVIPNAVDTNGFAQESSQDELAVIKKEIGKNEQEQWLIHTGRFVRKNGLDAVISALPLLPESVHVLLVGEGPDEDKLKALATSRGVDARVHFHRYVPLEEIPKYLKACDLFIRPSLSEGFGNSFVEAMAAGLPVIATQEGGIADFLFDAKRNPDKPTTGWVVDAKKPEQIAEAVRDILAHPEKVRTVLATAKQMVIEKYDWNLIAKNMREKVFARLLNSQ